MSPGGSFRHVQERGAGRLSEAGSHPRASGTGTQDREGVRSARKGFKLGAQLKGRRQAPSPWSSFWPRGINKGGVISLAFCALWVEGVRGSRSGFTCESLKPEACGEPGSGVRPRPRTPHFLPQCPGRGGLCLPNHTRRPSKERILSLVLEWLRWPPFALRVTSAPVTPLSA